MMSLKRLLWHNSPSESSAGYVSVTAVTGKVTVAQPLIQQSIQVASHPFPFSGINMHVLNFKCKCLSIIKRTEAQLTKQRRAICSLHIGHCPDFVIYSVLTKHILELAPRR